VKIFHLLYALPLLFSGVASAQDYPSRAIRVVVPYAVGGITDISARMVAQSLERAIGQTVIVDNKPGAATTVASNYVANQKPDGYTLYAASVSLPLNPYIQGNVAYKPYDDFTVLSGLTDAPFVLEVSAKKGITSMAQLVDEMKRNPGKMIMGASGVGSMNHIIAENWLKRSGLDALIVQYQGGNPTKIALLAGEIDMVFADLNIALPVIRANQAAAVAVATKSRLPELPDTPTVEESMGIGNFEGIFWTALLAPKGVSEEVIKKVSEAMNKVAQDEELKKKLEAQGVSLNIADAAQVLKRFKEAESIYAPILKTMK